MVASVKKKGSCALSCKYLVSFSWMHTPNNWTPVQRDIASFKYRLHTICAKYTIRERELTCSAIAGADRLRFKNGGWVEPPTNGDASSVSNMFMKYTGPNVMVPYLLLYVQISTGRCVPAAHRTTITEGYLWKYIRRYARFLCQSPHQFWKPQC